MIPPLPAQFGFAMFLAPVWRLETLPRPDAASVDGGSEGDAPPTGCAVAGSGGGADDPSPAASAPASEQRWIFDGFRWQAATQWSQWFAFVNPGWDHWVAHDPAELDERAARQAEERRAIEQASTLRQALREAGAAPADAAPAEGGPPRRARAEDD